MAPKLNASLWGSLTLGTVAITGSNVTTPLHAVTVGGDGTADEALRDEDAFGAPGIVFRPRPPEKVTGTNGQGYMVGTEAVAARMGDRLTPFSWRDLRFNASFPAPKPGTVALVGYAGGFLAFDDVGPDSGKETLATLYVPYDNGAKCHAIILDPEHESVKIVHGDGMALLLENNRAIIKNAGGDAYLEVGANGVIANGNTRLVGGLAVGPAGGQPLVNATALSVAIGTLMTPFAVVPPIPVTSDMVATLLTGLVTALTTGPARTTMVTGI